MPSTEDRGGAMTIHYQQKTIDHNTAMQRTEEEFKEKEQDGRFSCTEIFYYIKEGK